MVQHVVVDQEGFEQVGEQAPGAVGALAVQIFDDILADELDPVGRLAVHALDLAQQAVDEACRQPCHQRVDLLPQLFLVQFIRAYIAGRVVGHARAATRCW
ncbi:hypothetical protein [Azospirillum sp. INR13]|uniref:hypothetical protein n=1 Tax=Azospirillum sp. INR13 TaxID=2596919 RepID=UPI002103C92A|nr:hypothetical protein [Azospirillum sp. INR13]